MGGTEVRTVVVVVKLERSTVGAGRLLEDDSMGTRFVESKGSRFVGSMIRVVGVATGTRLVGSMIRVGADAPRVIGVATVTRLVGSMIRVGADAPRVIRVVGVATVTRIVGSVIRGPGVPRVICEFIFIYNKNFFIFSK